MKMTRERLLYDLYVAFYSARKGKGKRSYVLKWEKDMKANMEALCDDLITRRYQPLPSKCFIVEYPKKREIFAAMFRDRIVHHLYFNYTHKLFEQTFIQDSYSCIKGRGTHYGIARIEGMCRRESRNWQRKCYALHLDIRGYFMHIVRSKLLDIAVASLRKMAEHRVPRSICADTAQWKDLLDMDFVIWLTEVIVMLDPKQNCVIVGEPSSWNGLDKAKSLLQQPDGRGLPIGNLTSQLFSNVYLNVLDQYVKRELKCKYYGRYVDDALIIGTDKEALIDMAFKIRNFLVSELGLELHMGKLEISQVHNGIEFLGNYIRPWRKYLSHDSISRIEQKVGELDLNHPMRVVRSVNSYLGIMRHTASYRVAKRLFMREGFLRIGVFNRDMTKFVPKRKYFKHLKSQHL